MTAEPVPTIYPDGYRRCPICHAYIGARCTTVARSIIGGQVEGPPVSLDHPHVARKVRAGW